LTSRPGIDTRVLLAAGCWVDGEILRDAFDADDDVARRLRSCKYSVEKEETKKEIHYFKLSC
jgi:hypothetical protein